MIVSEKNVSDALAYLAIDPHPLALAQKDVTDGENLCKEIFARRFLAAEGPIDARKATAEIDESYVEAKKDEAEAILQLTRHRARIKAAEMILEIWRTENANMRAAERIR